MNKIRIGIICPSEIALRRFMPALKKSEEYEYIGVAYPTVEDWNGASEANIQAEIEKAEVFKNTYGGKVFAGYKTIIESEEIDAIYLPLPPALHFNWAKLALDRGKHVFVEKPSTTCLKDTSELVKLAKEKNLALHENYMFQYHKQIDIIKQLLDSKKVGDVRLIRANFGFPKRAENDFRYNKALGGGALLDCGGYPLRLMRVLLGSNIKVDAANLFFNENHVDIYGSAHLSTDKQVAQISFGMDNAYKCNIEIWGSKGTITTDRVFTAPEGFEVDIKINTTEGNEIIHVGGDDSFLKSLNVFAQCVNNDEIRLAEYDELINQIQLVRAVEELGGK